MTDEKTVTTNAATKTLWKSFVRWCAACRVPDYVLLFMILGMFMFVFPFILVGYPMAVVGGAAVTDWWMKAYPGAPIEMTFLWPAMHYTAWALKWFAVFYIVLFGWLFWCTACWWTVEEEYSDRRNARRRKARATKKAASNKTPPPVK